MELYVPPPRLVVQFPVNKQLFSVPLLAPPPTTARLPARMQLFRTAVESHLAPPPSPSKCPAFVHRVLPSIKVNPDNTALELKNAHRTAALPKPSLRVDVSWAPRITVACGPLTLCTVTGLSITTRLVSDPPAIRPPVS